MQRSLILVGGTPGAIAGGIASRTPIAIFIKALINYSAPPLGSIQSIGLELIDLDHA